LFSFLSSSGSSSSELETLIVYDDVEDPAGPPEPAWERSSVCEDAGVAERPTVCDEAFELGLMDKIVEWPTVCEDVGLVEVRGEHLVARDEDGPIES
jgi:hypothetical protein